MLFPPDLKLVNYGDAAAEQVAREKLETILKWLETQMPLDFSHIGRVVYDPEAIGGSFQALGGGEKGLGVVQVGGRHIISGAKKSGPAVAGTLAHEFQHGFDAAADTGRFRARIRRGEKAVNSAPLELARRVYQRTGVEKYANARMIEVIRAARRSPLIRKIGPLALLLAVLGSGAALLSGGRNSEST
mgnify:FL=1